MIWGVILVAGFVVIGMRRRELGAATWGLAVLFALAVLLLMSFDLHII